MQPGLDQLRRLVGLAPSYVSQLENGARNPTLGVVERFAAVFRVAPLDLLRS